MSDIVCLPMSKERVREEIRILATTMSGSIFLLDHAEMRMLEREINRRQVFNVLCLGDQIGQIEWDTVVQSGWKCKLNRMIAGDSITVVAKLIQGEENHCLVVTVW